MNYIKAKYTVPGRNYTFRTEDDVKPGDIVVNSKGTKLTVSDEPVDMAWVEVYDADKVSVVKKCEEPAETFNSSMAIDAQDKYCKEKGYPHFAPRNGRCYRCNKQIYEQIDHGNYKTGISVEKAGKELVTGCPHCNRTYCD